jgi:hypothetical protein
MNVQPLSERFLWELEVQLLNFSETGVPLHQLYCVMANQGFRNRGGLRRLRRKYPSVNWIVLKDERPMKGYIPSVRPWALSRVFEQHEDYFKGKYIFYFDSDMLFRELPDFAGMRDGDCHLSDTVSYLGYDYIRPFGEHYVDAMAGVIGISKELIIENQSRSGGAQHFFAPGVLSAACWMKVYLDSEKIYSTLCRLSDADRKAYEAIRKTDGGEYRSIQVWTADMWSLLWNLWKMGVRTVVDDRLSFSWATNPIGEWEKHAIYHNAGVTENRKHELFYKGAFPELPQDLDISGYSRNYCGIKYAEYVERVING